MKHWQTAHILVQFTYIGELHYYHNSMTFPSANIIAWIRHINNIRLGFCPKYNRLKS